MLNARRIAAGAVMVLAAFSLFPLPASALVISTRYRSPRNPERKVRQSTELIVLHTTEAPARSSLNKLSDRGEAHYCVTEEGQVFAIVDRDREAFHAGRSMWKGREDVDKFSIGIECVGYHDKPMSTVQLAAIRDLVLDLKRMYRLSDDKVVCHSHVAYGQPNRWQKRRHRGRKRCGMLFAMPSVRRALNLTSRPGGDVDTRAGRLVVGDPYLNTVLYGNVDTMVGKIGNAAATGSSGGIFSGLGRWFGIGSSSQSPQSPPPKSGVATAPKKPPPAAGTKPAVTPKASVSAKPTAVTPKSIAQLKAGGWVLRGTVSKTQTASKLAGGRWNAPDTFYTIRDKVIAGNKINAARIEKGMGVWTRKK